MVFLLQGSRDFWKKSFSCSMMTPILIQVTPGPSMPGGKNVHNEPNLQQADCPEKRNRQAADNRQARRQGRPIHPGALRSFRLSKP